MSLSSASSPPLHSSLSPKSKPSTLSRIISKSSPKTTTALLSASSLSSLSPAPSSPSSAVAPASTIRSPSPHSSLKHYYRRRIRPRYPRSPPVALALTFDHPPKQQQQQPATPPASPINQAEDYPTAVTRSFLHEATRPTTTTTSTTTSRHQPRLSPINDEPTFADPAPIDVATPCDPSPESTPPPATDPAYATRTLVVPPPGHHRLSSSVSTPLPHSRPTSPLRTSTTLSANGVGTSDSAGPGASVTRHAPPPPLALSTHSTHSQSQSLLHSPNPSRGGSSPGNSRPASATRASQTHTWPRQHRPRKVHYKQQQPISHRQAAARILRGHRAAPLPPSAVDHPLPLTASLMGERPLGLGPPPATAPKGGPEHPPPSAAALVEQLGKMDIRDALSRCEDATLSWSLQFWVTLADPLTRHVFFACPASGQCSWEPPVGALVVPRSPDGEWWELADSSRDNQSYYYNTLTGQTQWNRPEGDAFVIPLGLIQRNALQTPRSSFPSKSRSSSGEHGTVESHTSSVRFANSPNRSPNRSHPSPDPGALAQSATASSSGPLTPIPDMSPELASGDLDKVPGGTNWWDRRRARSRLRTSSSKSHLRTPEVSPVLGGDGTMMASPTASPTLGSDNGGGLQVSNSAVNLILQPSSPTSASYDLHNFSTEDFADRYFAVKRSGMLRQRLSLEQIMEWQRNPITTPLLVLSKASVQDAITSFKVIQHVMGERERPVDAARPPSMAHTGQILNMRRLSDGSAGPKDEKTIILEEIRWTIQLGVGRTEMRDELYCQLIKQLTRNPDQDATVLGFQLFCVFVAAFGPSKSFEPFVRSFLVGNVERPDFGIGVMSKFCLTRLDTCGQSGHRGRVLTIAEIEHASDAAFYPSVYGQTLQTIMQRQEGAYPELRIPIILPFLADGILALGGTEAEGIFRVPGDNDTITTLKARIDRGHYQLNGIEDPHVTASLFKLWLRELEQPLVPGTLYNAAINAAKSVDHSVLFLKKLPDHNRRVLLFVVSFIQLFLDPEVVAVTKMTPQNLALVLAPNILRTPTDSLAQVFHNSTLESQFVLNLLLHLDPPSVDPEYVPTHGDAGRRSLDSASSRAAATAEAE